MCYGNEYHLAIFSKRHFVTTCHEQIKVVPSLEYFTTDVLPDEMSFLEGQGLTPLYCALVMDNQELARFFISNWFLHVEDLSLRYCGMQEKLKLNEDSRKFVQNMFSQPWTLKSLTFVQVSTCLGLGPTRDGRVGNSGLPPSLQRWLRFETLEWKSESSDWSELICRSVHLNRSDWEKTE